MSLENTTGLVDLVQDRAVRRVGMLSNTHREMLRLLAENTHEELIKRKLGFSQTTYDTVLEEVCRILRIVGPALTFGRRVRLAVSAYQRSQLSADELQREREPTPLKPRAGSALVWKQPPDTEPPQRKASMPRARHFGERHKVHMYNGVDVNSNDVKRAFAINIRAVCKARKRSLAEICKSAGIHYSFINNLVHLTALLNEQRLCSFANALNVSPEFLATHKVLLPHEIAEECERWDSRETVHNTTDEPVAQALQHVQQLDTTVSLQDQSSAPREEIDVQTDVVPLTTTEFLNSLEQHPHRARGYADIISGWHMLDAQSRTAVLGILSAMAKNTTNTA